MTDERRTVTEASPAQEIETLVKEIAAQLNETQTAPLAQIRRMLTIMGTPFVQEQLLATQKIEQGDGMLTANGDRRRSIGGVFFHLTKAAMTPEQKALVFPVKGMSRATRTILWDERQALIDSLRPSAGLIHWMRLSVRSRPEATQHDEQTVRLIFQQVVESAPTQVYPRGVPAPPQHEVSWVVYLAADLWETFAAQPEQPKEELLFEGKPFWDAATGMMTLWAQSFTTGEAERSKRQKQLEKQAAQAEVSQKPKTRRSEPDKTPLTPQPSVVEPPVEPEKSVETTDKLSQLTQAAATLRERIAAKAAKGQKASLEQTLLQTAEKQMEQLRKHS